MNKKIRLTRPERRTQEISNARSSEVAVGAPSHTRTRTRADAPPPAQEPSPSQLRWGEGADVGAGRPERRYAEARTRVYAKGDLLGEPMQNKVDDILGLTAELSAAARKELLARLALAESGRTSAQDRDLNMWSQAVYDALVKVQGTSVPGPAVIKKLVGVSAAWEPLRDFMTATKLQDLAVVKRQSVYVLLARLVVEEAEDFCKWAKAPLGPKIVATRCRHVAGTFNKSFPGYIQAGLVSLVAGRLGQKVPP